MRAKCVLVTCKEMCPDILRFLQDKHGRFSVETKAMLQIIKDNVTMPQCEKKLNSPFGPATK